MATDGFRANINGILRIYKSFDEEELQNAFSLICLTFKITRDGLFPKSSYQVQKDSETISGDPDGF
jgi:hypothetical protein